MLNLDIFIQATVIFMLCYPMLETMSAIHIQTIITSVEICAPAHNILQYLCNPCSRVPLAIFAFASNSSFLNYEFIVVDP